MTDHPLTRAVAAEMWDEYHTPASPILRWSLASDVEREATLALLRAAHDAGREHERTNPEGDRPWELLGGAPRPGDEVRQDLHGVTTIAVVGEVDEDGYPLTTESGFIGHLDQGTWYVRRTAPELPTEDEAVIERADGHKYITAIFNGETYRAREAVLGRDGRWYGVWRRATPAPHVDTSVAPEHITPGTWKVDDR